MPSFYEGMSKEVNMINWKVRIKNKNFWLSLIPAVLLLVQTVLAAFGISIDFDLMSGKLLAILDALFVVLSILGIVNDPTTEGLEDSTLAMTYKKPKTKEGTRRCF